MQMGCEGRGKGENITEILAGGKGTWRKFQIGRDKEERRNVRKGFVRSLYKLLQVKSTSRSRLN